MDDTIAVALIAAAGSVVSAYLRHIHLDLRSELRQIHHEIDDIHQALSTKASKSETDEFHNKILNLERRG